eukprot:TRINITY_DN1376_c0_g2_i1.p1 TRINITY_DN1376_c0_g2~~TRINITY_DN1376_c0_g2_i1.p1  ORF type:complete len:315 (+),score=89.67 TRINITY_DN1376_c0_g2_i1:178-1122(+)
MTSSFNFSGGKRTCSEAPCQATFSAPIAAPCTTQNPSAESGGGGGSSTGEVEEEEEPSSSSFSGFGLGSPRSKRFKCALADIRAHTLEDSEELSAVKEYRHVDGAQLHEASKVARVKGGECISKVTIGLGDVLGFKCKFGHIFRCSIEDACKNWCLACSNYMEQCVDFARKNKGKLLDTRLTVPVTFQCHNGHIFTCKTYRVKHLKWCGECKRLEETQKKLQTEQKKAKDSETMSKEQEELFKEAKKVMEQEQAAKVQETTMRYEVYLEQIIRQRSMVEASSGKLSQLEAYWVNKILMTPIEVLVSTWYALCMT